MSDDLDIDFANVCRCCLLSNDTLTSLSSKSIVEGYLLAIPDAVEDTVGVRLTIDSNRPAQICPPCKSQLLSHYSFKQKCTRIHGILSTTDRSDLDVDPTISCRICLNIADKLTNIRSKTIVDGNLLELPALISDCVAFEVDNDDDVFQKICAACKSQFVNFFAFRAKFRRSESTLDSVFAAKTETKRMVKEEMEIVIEEEVEELISDQEDGAPELADDVEVIDDESEYEVMDVEEGEDGFVEYETLDSGEDDEISVVNEPVITETVEEKDENLEYACPICDRTFNDAASGLHHVSTAHNSSTSVAKMTTGKCKKCSKVFYGPNKSADHAQFHAALDLVADFMEIINCQHCSVVFASEEKLEAHYKLVHPQVSFEGHAATDAKDVENRQLECYECGLSLNGQVSFKNHFLVHHMSVYACPQCGISYSSLVRLATHMRQRHLNEEFNCKHCKKATFKSYHEFRNHLSSACPARQHFCTHCDKRFMTSKSLAAHLAVAETKNFQCYCGKSFRQKGELAIHARTHTGEKNFACSVCGKCYRTSSMRADHMDTHIEGKTFECTVCHMKLKTRTVLRNHMRRHSEGKTNICQHCPKRFHTKYHLKQHVERIHNRKEKLNNLCED